MRPARCSGRAADAGRCRGGRSGRSSATARSGSARCRCRARAARRPCPTGSSNPSTSRRGARPRGASRRRCRRSAPSPRAVGLRRCGFSVLVADRAARDEGLVDQALGDDHVHHRVQQRDVGVGLELQVRCAMARQLGAARIADDQLGAAASPRSSSRWRPPDGSPSGWRRSGTPPRPRIDVDHRVRHRAGADAFEQRGDRRGVAQPRAVVDVVAAEAGAHQLLEQVGLFVAALGGAEAGQRPCGPCGSRMLAGAAGEGRAPLPRSPRGTRPSRARGPS